MAVQQWFDRVAERQSPGDGIIPGAPRAMGLTVAHDDWRQAAGDMAAHGGRLLALWASRDDADGNLVRAAFIADAGVLVLSLPLTASETYPGIEEWFPSAGRMQRALRDLSGLHAVAADTRPWLRHAAWTDSYHPLIQGDAPPASP